MPAATGAARPGSRPNASPNNGNTAKVVEMQPPVARALPDRLARQLGAVQEEQQHDPRIRHDPRHARPFAARGQRARQHDGAEQHEDERFDEAEDTADHAAALKRVSLRHKR
jgi:hypothetical protein